MSDGRTGSAGRLEDIEAIRQLKYSYFRLLDTKRFDELGELLTEDATSAFQSGELSQDGRAAIVRFLKESLADPGIVTMHTGHHPEIDPTGDSEATGTWYLEDLVMVPAADFEIHGTALYRDEYVKVDGTWKIRHTGYERIFERQRRPSTGEEISFHSRF
jgi:ketosteroid isomerase-like protein